MPQELASVRMRRFLSTSGSREEKADAAAARRDRALHAWRNLGSPPPTRPRVQSYDSAAKNSTVISAGFLVPGTSVAEIYSKAVAVAASKPAAAGPPPSPSPLYSAASAASVRAIDPLPRPSFTDAPVIFQPTVCSTPKEVTPAGRSADSSYTSFHSANLNNSSILDSDNPFDCPLVDVSLPPLIPPPTTSEPSKAFENWCNDLSANVPDTSSSECMETGPLLNLNAGYYQCKNARRNKVCKIVRDVSVPNAGEKHTESPPHLGSFENQFENKIANCFIGTRYSQNCHQNISCSFDPSSLSCLICSTPHTVYANKNGTPVTLILSDQCFPPYLEQESDRVGNCARVLRVEDGFLGEIADLALEAFPKGLPINSVVLLGSGTHLLRAGSAGYAQAWLAACNKLGRIGQTVQICPLVPVFDSVSPGAIFRSLVELHCWYAELFQDVPRGLKDVWDKYIQNLKDQTPDCPPLGSPHVYTLLFPADIQSGSLLPMTFSSASSGPDRVHEPSRKATTELLLCLSQVLNRDFCTDLGPELNLPRDPQNQNHGTKELHFTLIGGSNLRNTKKHLEALGVKVTDLTKPGWIANTANAQQVMREIVDPSIPEDSIIVLDVLGNISVRFRQADDSCSLPVKLNGSWHLLGEVRIMEDEQVEKGLFTVEHLYKNLRKDSCKIFTSPSPRWLCGACCFDLAHCTNLRSDGYGKRILNELYRVRRCMKKTLIDGKVRNARVLDTLGTLTGKNTVDEQLVSLRKITSKDNVHLNESGLAALAQGLVREARGFELSKQKGKGSIAGNARLKTNEWRGFVSNSGNTKGVGFKAPLSKSQHRGKFHPYARGGKK